MSDSTVLLNPQDEIDIQNALNRLFTLRDKYIKREDMLIFLGELVKSERPVNAIIAGLDSLKDHDSKVITYTDMLAAIDKFVEKQKVEANKCQECSPGGYIVMKDESGYNFSLACNCENGFIARGQGNKVWNGSSSQHSNERVLFKVI